MQAHYVDPAHLTSWAPESVVCDELMEICHILRVDGKDSPPIIRSEHAPWMDEVSVSVRRMRLLRKKPERMRYLTVKGKKGAV